MQFGLEAVDCPKHLLAVLLKDLLPQGGVSSGDPGGIAEAASGEILPAGFLPGEIAAKAGC